MHETLLTTLLCLLSTCEPTSTALSVLPDSAWRSTLSGGMVTELNHGPWFLSASISGTIWQTPPRRPCGRGNLCLGPLHVEVSGPFEIEHVVQGGYDDGQRALYVLFYRRSVNEGRDALFPPGACIDKRRKEYNLDCVNGDGNWRKRGAYDGYGLGASFRNLSAHYLLTLDHTSLDGERWSLRYAQPLPTSLSLSLTLKLSPLTSSATVCRRKLCLEVGRIAFPEPGVRRVTLRGYIRTLQ